MQAFENAKIKDVENNYLQVFIKDKLIGLVYLQQFQLRHQHLNFSNPPTFLSRILQLILPAQLPLLICGNLFRIDFQGFYFKNAAHDLHVFDAIELFTKQPKNKPVGIIIKDCAVFFAGQHATSFKYHFFKI